MYNMRRHAHLPQVHLPGGPLTGLPAVPRVQQPAPAPSREGLSSQRLGQHKLLLWLLPLLCVSHLLRRTVQRPLVLLLAGVGAAATVAAVVVAAVAAAAAAAITSNPVVELLLS